MKCVKVYIFIWSSFSPLLSVSLCKHRRGTSSPLIESVDQNGSQEPSLVSSGVFLDKLLCFSIMSHLSISNTYSWKTWCNYDWIRHLSQVNERGFTLSCCIFSASGWIAWNQIMQWRLNLRRTHPKTHTPFLPVLPLYSGYHREVLNARHRFLPPDKQSTPCSQPLSSHFTRSTRWKPR